MSGASSGASARDESSDRVNRSAKKNEGSGGLSDVDAVDQSAGGGGDGSGQGGEQVQNSTRLIVHVDPPLIWHADWDAWLTYLAVYCKRTLQVIPVKETMSRAEWNKRLMRTKKGDDGSQLVPEGCDLYQRVYICTHGWKKRKSRSEGSRPKQHIRLTDCPFRFVAQCNLGRGELQVKHGCFMHNHVVSPSAYATYPTFRGVENALVEARTEGMLAVGAKRSRIYDYLLEHDQNVIQVDVDNMVREHASSVSTVDDNGATAREIVIFAAADPENLSSVAKTAGGETGVISLATAHMHPIYGRFCEVLLVDSSHKTNRYNYQLLTFMATNEFGEGAVELTMI
ncbi:hypothetical protein Pcac1_g18296 [Phytophthora cactorum]|nr:hypothetical protein Pcac1_g18296 [Phytophthora cactorum]